MYKKIVLCLSEKADEILEKQLAMLKERHHAKIESIAAENAAEYISDCEQEVLFISDDKELLSMARSKGITANDPQKMKESYIKAMEMMNSLLRR